MKIGFGYDVHRLVEGRPLMLGAVAIPHEKGLLGHSDADVLLHAIIDAVLGATGLGDIGKHFPASDDRYKDISSAVLLDMTAHLAAASGFAISNIDSTVVCERPRLAPHIDAMKANIANILKIDPSCVNIKAKTEEGLGFTGSGDGISAYAVVLLKERIERD